MLFIDNMAIATESLMVEFRTTIMAVPFCWSDAFKQSEQATLVK